MKLQAQSHDAVGNRTAMTDTTGLHTYTYDSANRLTKVGNMTYTWDARGNLTNDGVFTYTYNSAGRLARAEGVTATLVYTYNAAGLRVAQSVDGDVTTYAWDWASGLPEMLSEGGNLYLVGHETLGQWDGSEWAYHLPDALGSVRQATDGVGAVVSAREWTPYGVEVSTTQAGLGYTGEWQDTTLGLTYLRARWYAPYFNRFISPDTIVPDYRNPPSINRYLYALANPLKHTDPSGHSPPGTCYAQGRCDPNDEAATQWLLEAMRTNAVSSEARTIRLLNRLTLTGAAVPVPILLPPIPPLPPVIVAPCPALSIPPKVLAYIMWIEMVKSRAPWDFKTPIRERRMGFEWGGDNFRMCCDWYWYEAVSNIHYGYVGRAAGFTDLELKVGAGAAQYQEHRNAEGYRERIAEGEVGWHTYYDETEDRAGIQIGLDLYNEGISLTPEKFCEIFDRWAPQLKPANWYDRVPWI